MPRQSQVITNQEEVFKVMERKLYNFIMMPAMICLGFLVSFGLIHSLGFSVFLELWMQIKGVVSVLILTYLPFLPR